jgi:ubiquinol-cytochrome c reductase iron-sulfur subunit
VARPDATPAARGFAEKGKSVATTTTPEPTRRDFLYIATGAAAAVGAAFAAWPFIDQMNPSSAVLAAASIEVDLSAIVPGQQALIKWRGHPLFVRRRTPKEIAEARDVSVSELPDPDARNANLPDGTPATDANRATKPDWLILVGVCTHLGCTPTVTEGEYGGWLCHCHGSVYDTAGRIRKGPAPQNLAVPPYAFLTPTRIKVG